jgi:hypothetical protein
MTARAKVESAVDGNESVVEALCVRRARESRSAAKPNRLRVICVLGRSEVATLELVVVITGKSNPLAVELVGRSPQLLKGDWMWCHRSPSIVRVLAFRSALGTSSSRNVRMSA